MARARNIKPGFFINEDLVELPFSTRLLFIGLWTIADREGRLDDRPRKIKMAIFPADNVDVEQGLSELHGAGLILRYVVDNQAFIAIPGFEKHQNPHVNEQPSIIPAPELHDASTVDATPLTSSLNPSSLNPDSPSPISETPQAAAPKKGTRLPDPFLLTADMRAYASAKRPDVDIGLETEKFCNYWRAKTGKDATKLDWIATWRNWILNARSNSNGTDSINGRPAKPTSASRIAEHRSILDQYIPEADLGRIS